jgi:hypothetical protein
LYVPDGFGCISLFLYLSPNEKSPHISFAKLIAGFTTMLSICRFNASSFTAADSSSQFAFYFDLNKMGKVLSRAKKFYVDNLKCPNDGKFDPEFKLMLRILYFFGWYQPQPTKWRIAYGVCTFCGVLVTWSLGFMRYALVALQNENLFKGLIYTTLSAKPYQFRLKWLQWPGTQKTSLNMQKTYKSSMSATTTRKFKC